MANKNQFKTLASKLIPLTDAMNEERAPAYALSPKQMLARSAATDLNLVTLALFSLSGGVNACEDYISSSR